MRDADFDDSLAALADHARRTGKLGPAAAIRGRADRRRRRRYAASSALGVVAITAAGISLGQGILSSQERPQVPASTPTPTPRVTGDPVTGDPVTGDPFSGEREVQLTVVQAPGSVLAVDSEGRVHVAPAVGNSTLFVLTPMNGFITIRVVRPRQGGARACLTVTEPVAAEPAVLAALPCAQNKYAQQFSFDPAVAKYDGKVQYGIENSGYVQWNSSARDGVVVENPPGGGDPRTTFLVTDRGPAAPDPSPVAR